MQFRLHVNGAVKQDRAVVSSNASGRRSLRAILLVAWLIAFQLLIELHYLKCAECGQRKILKCLRGNDFESGHHGYVID